MFSTDDLAAAMMMHDSLKSGNDEFSGIHRLSKNTCYHQSAENTKKQKVPVSYIPQKAEVFDFADWALSDIEGNLMCWIQTDVKNNNLYLHVFCIRSRKESEIFLNQLFGYIRQAQKAGYKSFLVPRDSVTKSILESAGFRGR